MSFFSAQRLSSLANRLGSSILTELVQDLEDLLVTRVCAMKETPKIEFKPPREKAKITPSDFLSYTDCEFDFKFNKWDYPLTRTAYFEKIHPLYPFLDKQEFISHNAECQRNGTSECSKVCSALYHAVLAIGSQYHGGATFEAGLGLSWNLFQSSLGLMPDILAPPYSLIKLQVWMHLSNLINWLLLTNWKALIAMVRFWFSVNWPDGTNSHLAGHIRQQPFRSSSAPEFNLRSRKNGTLPAIS